MQRIKNDFYPTESALTQLLLKHVPISGTVFEPCAGDSAIADVLRQHKPIKWNIPIIQVLTNDINLNQNTDYSFDASDDNQWDIKKFDWIVTNPPYTQPTCQQIIQNSWDNCEIGIAMFLRLSYLEPCNERAKFLRSASLSHLIVVNPRPKFRADTKGTDSVTSAWFVWQKQHTGDTNVIYEIDWRSDPNQLNLFEDVAS